MNKTKIIVSVVVAVVVVVAAWWWLGARKESSNSGMPTPTSTAQSPAGTVPTGTASDDSDQSIAQSMTNIDTQMNGLNSDSATADQSLNDKPVDQQDL